MRTTRAQGSILLLTAFVGAGRATAESRPAYLPAAASRPAPSPPAYPLRREPGRGWVFEDKGFVARITEDGSVRFQDRHGDLSFALPLPMATPPGTPTVEGALRGLANPRARPRATPPVDSVGPIPGISPYRPDPAEWCRYPQPCFFEARIMLVNVAGTFDVTDEIMRLGHKDPYRSQKARFLASTAAFREELGRRAAVRARAEALEGLRARLEAIERDPQLGPAERRTAIRALAADLDPDPTVAAPARALIDAHLRARADAGLP